MRWQSSSELGVLFCLGPPYPCVRKEGNELVDDISGSLALSLQYPITICRLIGIVKLVIKGYAISSL